MRRASGRGDLFEVDPLALEVLSRRVQHGVKGDSVVVVVVNARVVVAQLLSDLVGSASVRTLVGSAMGDQVGWKAG